MTNVCKSTWLIQYFSAQSRALKESTLCQYLYLYPRTFNEGIENNRNPITRALETKSVHLEVSLSGVKLDTSGTYSKQERWMTQIDCTCMEPHLFGSSYLRYRVEEFLRPLCPGDIQWLNDFNHQEKPYLYAAIISWGFPAIF